MPVAIGKQEISSDLLFHNEMYQLPQIIGPLMDNLQVQKFALIISFGSDEFYDKDDWYENWRIIFWFQYPISDKDRFPGWPPLIDEKSISDHKRIALEIVKFSSDRIMKG
jgi:hypothetical protein